MRIDLDALSGLTRPQLRYAAQRKRTFFCNCGWPDGSCGHPYGWNRLCQNTARRRHETTRSRRGHKHRFVTNQIASKPLENKALKVLENDGLWHFLWQIVQNWCWGHFFRNKKNAQSLMDQAFSLWLGTAPLIQCLFLKLQPKVSLFYRGNVKLSSIVISPE